MWQSRPKACPLKQARRLRFHNTSKGGPNGLGDQEAPQAHGQEKASQDAKEDAFTASQQG
jgi:hypothetical protein